MWVELQLTSNHNGLGVSSKTVLEEPGEHRVSVRDEELPVRVGMGGHISWWKKKSEI